MASFFWCPVCARAYRDGQQRASGPMRLCAYRDCNCWADLAQVSWSSVRRMEPQLPLIPEANIRYAVKSPGWV